MWLPLDQVTSRSHDDGRWGREKQTSPPIVSGMRIIVGILVPNYFDDHGTKIKVPTLYLAACLVYIPMSATIKQITEANPT